MSISFEGTDELIGQVLEPAIRDAVVYDERVRQFVFFAELIIGALLFVFGVIGYFSQVRSVRKT